MGGNADWHYSDSVKFYRDFFNYGVGGNVMESDNAAIYGICFYSVYHNVLQFLRRTVEKFFNASQSSINALKSGFMRQIFDAVLIRYGI